MIAMLASPLGVNTGREVFAQSTGNHQPPVDGTLEVNACLVDRLTCDGTKLDVPETPTGDTPSPKTVGWEHILQFTNIPSDPPYPVQVLTPGRRPSSKPS